MHHSLPEYLFCGARYQKCLQESNQAGDHFVKYQKHVKISNANQLNLQSSYMVILNPFTPKGIPHSHQLDQSISDVRVRCGALLYRFHIFALFLTLLSGILFIYLFLFKLLQNIVECGVWYGSALFAYVQEKGRQA